MHEILTGIDVVQRWPALAAEIAVVVSPPSASANTDVAALFKLLHVVKGHSYAVYDHVRYETALTSRLSSAS